MFLLDQSNKMVLTISNFLKDKAPSKMETLSNSFSTQPLPSKIIPNLLPLSKRYSLSFLKLVLEKVLVVPSQAKWVGRRISHSYYRRIRNHRGRFQVLWGNLLRKKRKNVWLHLQLELGRRHKKSIWPNGDAVVYEFILIYLILFKLHGQPFSIRRRNLERRHVHQIKNTANFTVILWLHRQLISLYGTNGELRPQDLARCMIDTYRAMNKHYIPTGYELSSFAK